MQTQISTVEDAFIAKGYDPAIRPDVSHLPEHLRDGVIANFELDVVNEALNDEGLEEPWKPNYEDFSQDKYEPWFRRDSSAASGWSLYGVALWGTGTDAGARRNYRTEDIAEYAANQFIDLYARILG